MDYLVVVFAADLISLDQAFRMKVLNRFQDFIALQSQTVNNVVDRAGTATQQVKDLFPAGFADLQRLGAVEFSDDFPRFLRRFRSQ